MASTLETIITNLQTAVAGITVANGFHTDVKLVSLDPISWDEVDDAKVPFVIIGLLPSETRAGASEIVTPATTKEFESLLRVSLYGYLRAATNLWQTYLRFREDVIRKIYSDITLSNAAISVYVQGTIAARKAEKKDLIEAVVPLEILHMPFASSP